MPFLKTKLYTPPIRSEFVSRPRLIELLEAGSRPGRKLTLVSAPAGFGKTTLLTEWSQLTDQACAWLSLDDGDNDPVRFLTYLLAALQTIDSRIGETAHAMLQAPQVPPWEPLLTTLVNDIAETPHPCILVLDDYHLIEAQPVHDSVAFVLDHGSPQIHLVIATRADPPLPIARLRGRGQLTEVHAKDLRFTASEVAVFLNEVMGLSLSADQVAALEMRTEGWIAGLQLAALSMQGRDDIAAFIKAFTGSQHFVADYLTEEVLCRQSDAIRSFLLQTSVLDRLTGPLCDAVTGRADSQELLELLEDANLFVIPLDEEQRWYRYHQLFADLLRHHLRHRGPDLEAELHRRASEWYAEEELISEAVRHALAAGEQGRAAWIIEQNAMPMLMLGELATVLNWIKTVEPLAHTRPWLSIYQSWALTLSGQLDRVGPWLHEAENLASSHDRVDETEEMSAHIAAIRAYQAAQKGEAATAIDLADRALKRLSKGNTALHSVVTLALGIALRLSGDLVGASRALEEAVHSGQAAGNTYSALGALSSLAGLLLDQGRLHEAFRAYSEMVDWATPPHEKGFSAAGMAFFGLGLICYEWNDLEGTLRHTGRAIELCQRWGNVGILIGCHVLLFRVQQAQGELESARESLYEAERLVRAHPLAPKAANWTESFRARSWLAQGDIEAASRWAEQRGLENDEDFSYLRDEEYLTLARVLLARGEYDKALSLLDRLYGSAEEVGRTGSLIEILVLQTLTLQAMDELSQALATIKQAFSLAEPEGYVRTFVDEGEPMAKLLRKALTRDIAPCYVGALLAAFGEDPEPPPTVAQPLIEPLSERELQVLGLIAAGLSNREIAQALVVEVSTIKSHNNHIYAKLDVKSRTEAVARARAIGLL